MAASSTGKSSVHRKKSHKTGHHNDKHLSSKRRKEGHHLKQDKFKTLSQLAKLVQSGKLKIPCSLVEYVDDHASLIDQLFTILTVEDIEGMLPDILKGIKLKKVKHLCYVQLEKLTQEELRRIITQSDDERGETERRKPDSVTSEESGGQIEESGSPIIADISHDEESEENSLSRMEDLASEDQVEIEVNPEMSDFDDLSDGKGNKAGLKTDSLEGKTEEECQSKPVQETHANEEDNLLSGVKRQKKMEIIKEEEGEEEMESEGVSCEGRERGGKWREDIPEDARVMEMKLREKLLEAQLKRLEERERVMKGGGHGSAGDASLTGEEEPGELVELDLRQRALESLLAKRREKMGHT